MELSTLFGNEKFNYYKLKVKKSYYVKAYAVSNYGKDVMFIYPYEKLDELRAAKKSALMVKRVKGMLKQYKNGTDAIYDIFYYILQDVIVGIKDVDIASQIMREMFTFSNYALYIDGYLNKEQFIDAGLRFLNNMFVHNATCYTRKKFIEIATDYMNKAQYNNPEYEIVEIKESDNND